MKHVVGATLPDHGYYRYREDSIKTLVGVERLVSIIFSIACNKRIHCMLVLTICFLGLIVNATEPDDIRENTIAESLASKLEFGELIWLHTGNEDKFPGIYTVPPINENQRAVILLHGMSAHMDWPVVISPLREFFRDDRWTSLSIQMPGLAPDKPPAEYGNTIEEASNRIKSAIHFLLEQQYNSIILIGYGFGATSAAYFLAKENTNEVSAFVGISMFEHKYLVPQVHLLGYLEDLYLPTLDIYGSNDLPVVTRTADDRRLYSQKNGTYLFSQIKIEGADHYYNGYEQILFNRITDWLEEVLTKSDQMKHYQ